MKTFDLNKQKSVSVTMKYTVTETVEVDLMDYEDDFDENGKISEEDLKEAIKEKMGQPPVYGLCENRTVAVHSVTISESD